MADLVRSFDELTPEQQASAGGKGGTLARLYPVIINGRFDPFQWAADPERRSDFFDAHAPVSGSPDSDTVITGFAGAAGRVEGLVRCLDSAEEGHELQAGEVLVTTTTNVGWTPLFPRAAAIVTDMGAPRCGCAMGIGCEWMEGN
jgi:phosphoenolpyruvate synthase/pyruvate phosphate dikinase